MEKIIINGAPPLFGEVKVSGSKNAALPILFSTVITHGISVIENLPDIGDTAVALKILEELGAHIVRLGSVVYIDTRELVYSSPNNSLVSKIRASTYLIGACLSRFGECVLGDFGGCNFSKRPIDLHILACEALGASIDNDKITAKNLVGAEINFPKPSVGATVNAIILAAAANGETVIRGHAREPHINALVDFLISAGADIVFSETEIRIKGKPLSGGRATVIGDMIEAGTYLVAGLVTDGCVTVRGIHTQTMSALLNYLSSLGAELSVGEEDISVRRGDCSYPIRVIAEPYPGFPTDLQPIMAPLMACLSGGILRDTVWQSRFGYLREISAFGVRSSPVGQGYIIKKSVIKPALATSPDLRGGMACVLCALAAEGKSIIASAKTVLRGYENLEQKLRALGADVKIEF